MSFNNWPSNNYEALFDVWHGWLSQARGADEQWPILDRWLKNNLRSLDVGSGAKGKNHSRDKNQAPGMKVSDQLAISAAMFSAMRFVNLACALEQSYRGEEALDWDEWDKGWTQYSVQKIPPAAFWYWVALRCDGGNLPPRILRDAAERKIWFGKMQAAMEGEEGGTLTSASLLWQGLRPQWLMPLIERAETSLWARDQLDAFVALQNQPPPLWLRAQRDISLTELQQKLAQEGVELELVDQQHLSANGGAAVNHTNTYKEGFVEIQDLASQRIAAAVAVKPGEKVWDACAGAGGKSLAIAARMKNKGAVIATDLHAYKLEELKRRAKRGEFHNIRVFEWQGREPLRLPKEVAQQQGFDWVLIDAPCSSSGTWRRNPDARWRFNDEDTAELIELQQVILQNASAAVRVNGYLVYATCSWQVSENETQVDNFLVENTAFSLVSQQLVGAPEQNADTMFVALMQRKL